MKRFLRVLTAWLASAVIMSVFPAAVFAGTWRLDNNGWWYQNDDGSWTSNGWQEIGGKYYYFNGSGYMLANTTTPDGYQVGADGAWIQNQGGAAAGLQTLEGSFACYTADGTLQERFISGNNLGGSYTNSDGRGRGIPMYTVTWNGDGTGTASSGSANGTLYLKIIDYNTLSINGDIYNRV